MGRGWEGRGRGRGNGQESHGFIILCIIIAGLHSALSKIKMCTVLCLCEQSIACYVHYNTLSSVIRFCM